MAHDLSEGPVALFERPVEIIEVTGADRLTYLNDVTTQQFSEQMIGVRTDALVLDGHGSVQAAFGVAVLAERTLLLAPHPDVTAYVLDVLANRTFLLDVRFTRTTLRLYELRGDNIDDLAAATNLQVRPNTVRPSGTDLMLCGRDGPIELIGEQSALDTIIGVLHDAGVGQSSETDRDDRRVRHGEPAYGSEIRPPHLPEELGLLPTHVHLAKGCYPGQEAVARMWMLGRPRRRLALLELSDQGEPGVFTGSGRDSVELTSVATTTRHALGFVPADGITGDVMRRDDGRTATIIRIIGGDSTPPGHDPAVTRRRDRQ